eukprot:460475-Amorphochlora_amoeboformis.AAC.1
MDNITARLRENEENRAYLDHLKKANQAADQVQPHLTNTYLFLNPLQNLKTSGIFITVEEEHIRIASRDKALQRAKAKADMLAYNERMMLAKKE